MQSRSDISKEKRALTCKYLRFLILLKKIYVKIYFYDFCFLIEMQLKNIKST